MRDIDPTAGEWVSSGYIARSRPGGQHYDFGSILGVGSSLLGGIMGSDAADDAASAQSASAAAGIAEQRRQFDAVQKLLSPYANTGTDALNAQRVLLGLGSGAGAPQRDAIYQELLPQFTKAATAPTWVPGYDVGPETTVPGYWQQGQSGSIDQAGLEAAVNARLAQYKPTVSPQQEQAAAIAQLESSPYFQSVSRQGEDAILQNASATGGLRGGNVQAALSQFRPQLLQQLIDQQYTRLGGLTSVGQNAAAGVGNAGMSTGNNVAQLLGQQGAAQAGAAVAGANAWTGALNGINSAYGKWSAGQVPAYMGGGGLNMSDFPGLTMTGPW